MNVQIYLKVGIRHMCCLKNARATGVMGGTRHPEITK